MRAASRGGRTDRSSEEALSGSAKTSRKSASCGWPFGSWVVTHRTIPMGSDMPAWPTSTVLRVALPDSAYTDGWVSCG